MCERGSVASKSIKFDATRFYTALFNSCVRVGTDEDEEKARVCFSIELYVSRWQSHG